MTLANQIAQSEQSPIAGRVEETCETQSIAGLSLIFAFWKWRHFIRQSIFDRIFTSRSNGERTQV